MDGTNISPLKKKKIFHLVTMVTLWSCGAREVTQLFKRKCCLQIDKGKSETEVKAQYLYIDIDEWGITLYDIKWEPLYNRIRVIHAGIILPRHLLCFLFSTQYLAPAGGGGGTGIS